MVAVPPVKITGLPEQTVFVPLMLTVGVVFTVTVAVLVVVQVPLDPVTVYTVVELGFTDIVLVVALVLHEYEVAVAAVKVALCPLHMVGLLTAKVGVGVTVKVIVVLAVQVPLLPLKV